MKHLAPSELFRRLLARLLGPSEEDALGDLDEEFTRRVRLHGRVGSELWYTIEAVSLVAAIVKSTSLRRPRKDTVIRVGPVSATARSGLGLGHDLRHVMRSLRRDATWTAVIITTLAVAIGATKFMRGQLRIRTHGLENGRDSEDRRRHDGQ